MSVEPSRLYVFGAFHLDANERELLCEGTVVPVASKTMDVLLILVENAGQVTERAELIKRVWPDSDGAEGSLAVTVSALRKTLGDRPDGGPYIETVPRQGYRFAASVTAPVNEAILTGLGAAPSHKPGVGADQRAGQQADGAVVGSIALRRGASEKAAGDSSDQVPARDAEGNGETTSSATRQTNALRWLATHKTAVVVAVVIAIVVVLGYVVRAWRSAEPRASVRRLAILPFRNLKPDDQTEFLGSSLADATTTRLRSFSSLIVRPFSYMEKYRGVDVDPKKVAEELDVDTLMTGTFLKDETASE